MKYLALAVTALFLASSPLAAFAQDNDGGSNTGGNNTGGTATGGGNKVDNNTAGTNNGDDGANVIGNEKSSCADVVAGSYYESFSKKCRDQIDKWANEQAAERSLKYEGDIAVGKVLPKSIEIVEVPAYRNYGYAMLNNKRVLVDRNTRTVVRVY